MGDTHSYDEAKREAVRRNLTLSQCTIRGGSSANATVAVAQLSEERLGVWELGDV